MTPLHETPASLTRILGRRDVLALAFGAMVGWSWVVLVGEMIVRAGSIGAMLAFVTGAAMVYFVGLTYAELTSSLARAGGELSFVFVGLGPKLAYVCGWTLVLAYLSVCAFEAVALPTVLGYLLPEFEIGFLYTIAGWDVHATWVGVGVMGALAIGLVNYFGVKVAAFVQGIAACLLLGIGISFFLPGIVLGNPEHLVPVFTGVDGYLRVVVMTPFLFLGFDVIPQIAEDIDVPRRTIGRLILLSIALALSWYILVHWTVGMTLPALSLNARELPTADAMSVVYGNPWGGRALVIGGVLGIITSWNAFFMAASRLLFAMGRGAMLPAVFGRLHPRYQSPVAAILLLTTLTAIAPFVGRPALVWFVDAGGFAAVLAYFLVAVSFLIIRQRFPNIDRPYRIASPRLVGGCAIVSTLFFFVLYLPGSPAALVWPYEWVIIAVWAILGLLLTIGLADRVGRIGSARREQLVLGEYTALFQKQRK